MVAQTQSYDGVHFQVALMNMNDGSVQGHSAGCADLKRGVRKFSEPSQADDIIDVLSKQEARESYNADFDEETDGWYEIEWLPCAKHIPATHEADVLDVLTNGAQADLANWPTVNDEVVTPVTVEKIVEVKRGRKWTYIFIDGEQVMEVRTHLADQVLATIQF